ncbi:hypothetical protein [Aliikangiella sp. IMCC44359]|uniref:hypothetical protein n=1 Tax=Aliikangiella sp. IMCC44359 TaxID=3459125 RepID=UPI00403B03C0
MLVTHRDAENRYTKIRQAVLDEVNKDLVHSKHGKLKATLINQSALAQADKWSYSSNRRVDWEWFKGYSSFRYRYPKRFEMALWHGNSLTSLSLGRPTYRGSKMRLDFLEGNPDKSKDIKVFEHNFLAISTYTQVLGADELRLMNPINNIVKSYYESFGFRYVTKGDYLYIRL